MLVSVRRIYGPDGAKNKVIQKHLPYLYACISRTLCCHLKKLKHDTVTPFRAPIICLHLSDSIWSLLLFLYLLTHFCARSNSDSSVTQVSGMRNKFKR